MLVIVLEIGFTGQILCHRSVNSCQKWQSRMGIAVLWWVLRWRKGQHWRRKHWFRQHDGRNPGIAVAKQPLWNISACIVSLSLMPPVFDTFSQSLDCHVTWTIYFCISRRCQTSFSIWGSVPVLKLKLMPPCNLEITSSDDMEIQRLQGGWSCQILVAQRKKEWWDIRKYSLPTIGHQQQSLDC